MFLKHCLVWFHVITFIFIHIIDLALLTDSVTLVLPVKISQLEKTFFMFKYHLLTAAADPNIYISRFVNGSVFTRILRLVGIIYLF